MEGIPVGCGDQHVPNGSKQYIKGVATASMNLDDVDKVPPTVPIKGCKAKLWMLDDNEGVIEKKIIEC